jgi:hypothetical protein
MACPYETIDEEIWRSAFGNEPVDRVAIPCWRQCRLGADNTHFLAIATGAR